MKKPAHIPDCQFRDPYSMGVRICHCSHPDNTGGKRRKEAVEWKQCETCTLTGNNLTQLETPRKESDKSTCIYRTAPTRTEQCPTCQGIKTHTVYGCEIHGECVLTKSDWSMEQSRCSKLNIPFTTGSFKNCESCKDRSVSEQECDSSHLAIICSHFNPQRYNLPISNYWKWRNWLGPLQKNLTTVELSFDGHFAIHDSIRIRGGPENLMFQKESLLNVALKQLDKRIQYVAWMDTDIILHSEHWAQIAMSMLSKNYHAVQLNSALKYLDKNGHETYEKIGGVKMFLETGKCTGTPGGSWMARRSLLDAVGGLCATMIAGGGDVPAFDAMTGACSVGYYRHISDELRDENKQWIRTVRENIHDTNVGYLKTKASHLYHGTRENRYYTERTKALSDFNPLRDIRMNGDGIWEWSSKKPELHAYIANYFATRKEDD